MEGDAGAEVAVQILEEAAEVQPEKPTVILSLRRAGEDLHFKRKNRQRSKPGFLGILKSPTIFVRQTVYGQNFLRHKLHVLMVTPNLIDRVREPDLLFYINSACTTTELKILGI